MDVEGDLTIYAAAGLKAQILERLSNCEELEIDLGKVVEIDTAGLQLLVLAKREALQAGKALCLTNHSHAVVEVMELCGLGGYFGDPMVITSA